MTIEEMIGKIDLTALAATEVENFTAWLVGQGSLQTSIERAFRHGQSVRAYSIVYRKRTDFAVRIE